MASHGHGHRHGLDGLGRLVLAMAGYCRPQPAVDGHNADHAGTPMAGNGLDMAMAGP